jgi:hypothetical protein
VAVVNTAMKLQIPEKVEGFLRQLTEYSQFKKNSALWSLLVMKRVSAEEEAEVLVPCPSIRLVSTSFLVS